MRPSRSPLRMLALTLGCATATVFSGALTSPAVAAPAGTAAKSPLDSCVQVAGERKLEKWSCLGGQLSWETTEKGQDGSARQVAHVERIAAEVADVPTAITADDYDYWCENGSTCTRKISNYISETKGNGAYGDSHGTIGNHDLIIRTSLNGRQANWNVSVIWDGGPTIYFSNFNVNCREDQFGPDPNCGVFRAIGNGNYVGPSRTRVNSGTIYGNRLNDSDPYYAQLGGYFTPDGYPRFTFGTLNTARWNCFGTSNCVFP